MKEYYNNNTVTSTNTANYNTNNNNNNNNTHSFNILGFYKQKPKGPVELVKLLKYTLTKYNSAVTAGKDYKYLHKLSGDFSKPISLLKVQVLQSEEDVAARGDYDLQMFLIREIYENDLLGILCREIEKFPFETRKEAVIIFNSLLRRQIPPNRQIVAEHIRDSKRDLLVDLLKGYDKNENTLHYGLMLRECIKYEFLTEIILNLPEFDRLFAYIQLPTFDVSSDAFATFKDLLTRHKTLVAEHLPGNYERIFKNIINSLLVSENYVTKRQSLKLLGEILHDRRNYEVMLRYVSDVDNLKLLMTQLRDKSEKIQYEAFQVFKIFIANPNKPKPIYDILSKNRDKILHFLESFNLTSTTNSSSNGNTEGRNFNDDKIFLIEKLQQLPQYVGGSNHGNTSAATAAATCIKLKQQQHQENVQISSKSVLEQGDQECKNSCCSEELIEMIGTPVASLTIESNIPDSINANFDSSSRRSITPDSLQDSESFLSFSVNKSSSASLNEENNENK